MFDWLGMNEGNGKERNDERGQRFSQGRALGRGLLGRRGKVRGLLSLVVVAWRRERERESEG